VVIEGQECLPLRSQGIALADEGSGSIDTGILHGGKDLVDGQRLQRFLRPATHESLAGTFAIGGQGIGCIVPGGNHDGQCSMQMLAHPGTSRRNMLGPRVDACQTLLLAPGGRTGKFVPADGIGEWMCQL